MIDDYLITSEEAAKIALVFSNLNEGGAYIDGPSVRKIFEKSNIPKNVLGDIWHLVDIDKDCKLNEPEFIVFMKMASLYLRTRDVPKELPPVWVSFLIDYKSNKSPDFQLLSCMVKFPDNFVPDEKQKELMRIAESKLREQLKLDEQISHQKLVNQQLEFELSGLISDRSTGYKSLSSKRR
ncbi:Intersectin-2 [Thelohanellus kitauei]|uniref:Intersectin-2 n=1 Tax=Thelohanellus kitauei TaxID=669202 RepID=A0A0C2JB35_THEKT|nr:Intersectin-2 [Thelohanellus kitauei]